MPRLHRLVAASLVVSAIVLFSAACTSERGRATELTDLSAPRGLTALEDGSILVCEVGRGGLLKWHTDGTTEELVTGLPTTLDSGPGGNYPAGLGAALPHGDGYALLVGEFKGDRFARFYVSNADGDAEAITPPTSLDLPAENRFSNPYDLVDAPGGWLVSDSGRNAVLRVTEDGDVSDYAVFDRLELTGEGTFTTAEVVPTGITRGPDGAVYVASLTGYPFPQGRSNVYRVEDQNHDGDAMDPGEVTVYASGFSAATDLVFDSDGSLLVTEFSTDMRGLTQDYGVDHADKVPGRLVRWSSGEISIVADGLVSPTSVVVSEGTIYVSEEFAGRVTEVR